MSDRSGMLLALGLLVGVAAVACGCASEPRQSEPGDLRHVPVHASVEEALRALERDGSGSARVPISEGAHTSVAAIATREPVRVHYHALHDEIVVVHSGEGTMRLGDEQFRVRPGDVIFIPEGTRHGFTPSEGGVATVVSVFAPPFDGRDRVFVE